MPNGSMSHIFQRSGIQSTHFTELLIVMPHLNKVFKGLLMA